MNSNTPIAIIGAGHLGRSLLERLVRNGHQNLIATRRTEAELRKLQTLSPSLVLTTDDSEAAEQAEVIIVATKEANFVDFAKFVRSKRKNNLLISLGPTFNLKKLAKLFGPKNIRLITPVDASVDLICFSTDSFCTAEDEESLKYIFGDHIQKIAEKEMPVATAYVLFRGILNSIFEPFCTVGCQEGMEEALARKIIGEMLISTGEEIKQGVSAQERLSKASGGLNEQSFTMQLYKQLEPAQNLLKELFEKVCKDFKNS